LPAIHHVVTLAAKTATAASQWTSPIINIEEFCYGVVHPVTKQAITHYRKLMNDPHLKDLWVPAMSKEIHCLAQGKPGVTKATDTIFLSPTLKSNTSPQIKQSRMHGLSLTIVPKRRIPTTSVLQWEET
jgi:hypothetical protein